VRTWRGECTIRDRRGSRCRSGGCTFRRPMASSATRNPAMMDRCHQARVRNALETGVVKLGSRPVRTGFGRGAAAPDAIPPPCTARSRGHKPSGV